MTSIPDLLRLVAVPALGWAAYRDVKVRRVPNRLWYPLFALGGLLLAWEGYMAATAPVATGVAWRLFFLQSVVSLGFVVPAAYLIWRLGGWGGADAKALMALALLYPTTPTYTVPVSGPDLAFPLTATTLGAFSLTILTNTMLVAASYPAVLAVRNLLGGDLSVLMLVGARVPCESIPQRHGSLLETPDGRTRRGLDVDALRMYLRWRDRSLAELREDPGRYRDPASLPDEPGEPGDGAIADGGAGSGANGPSSGPRTDGGPASDANGPSAGAASDGDPVADADGMPDGSADDGYDDPWGAAAFLDSVPHAWGTTPEDLRRGLDVLVEQDEVWYSPGIPFVVPMFVGLLVSLVYGDLLVSAMLWLGL